MNRSNEPPDPTDERTTDQTRDKGDEELIARRRAARDAAPRRYEVDEDPVMPADDATLKTKI